MDAHKLELADASADVILIAFTLQFFADPSQVLRECRRVLKHVRAIELFLFPLS
jgi:ubiquinone/menaquinone biosynthesis C-methylase UbiE